LAVDVNGLRLGLFVAASAPAIRFWPRSTRSLAKLKANGTGQDDLRQIRRR